MTGSYPYYTLDEAKKKVWAAVEAGRIRVTRNGEFVPPEQAIAALESNDRSVGLWRDDILREFPPLSPPGSA